MSGAVRNSARSRAAIAAATVTAAILMAGAASLAYAAGEASPEVRVAEGAVRGKVVDGVSVFYAIPFAAPPVGALRFHAPEPPKPWTGVRDATEKGSSCPQGATGGDPAGKASTDEDCLQLNVFAPATKSAAKRPVMVWIHGGGWGEGYSAPRTYDPSALVKEGGVVVVSINYRLSVLGLLATKSLDEANGSPSGNWLIEDHQQALRWIKKNIAAFGGDPSNVTIVGESAGANSTLALVTSPLSKGLFEKAIVQSGVDDAHTLSRARQEATGEQIAESFGCAAGAGQVDCLRKVPVEQLLKGRHKLGITEDPQLFPVDPYTAYQSGQFNHIPMIIGSNLHEGYFFMSGAEARTGLPMTAAEYKTQFDAYGADADAAMKAYPIAGAPSPAAAAGDAETDIRFSCYMDMARVGASKYAPIYGFELNEPSPAQQLPRKSVSLANTAYHTSDLAYLFDYETTAPLTGDAAKLGHKMRAYWIQFMKTGSPNGAGLPAWPQFHGETNTVLNLSNAGGVTTDFEARHHCASLEQTGLVYAGVK